LSPPPRNVPLRRMNAIQRKAVLFFFYSCAAETVFHAQMRIWMTRPGTECKLKRPRTRLTIKREGTRAYLIKPTTFLLATLQHVTRLSIVAEQTFGDLGDQSGARYYIEPFRFFSSFRFRCRFSADASLKPCTDNNYDTIVYYIFCSVSRSKQENSHAGDREFFDR
jgi:hypothetical protein